MTPISLEAAAVVTEKSKSTLWRRVSDGDVARLDSHRRRTMIALEDITPLLSVRMTAEELQILAAADSGDPESQDDIGQLFLTAGKVGAALYWLALAARQGYPNAMQLLGTCYMGGKGVPRDEHLSVMWIARAAARGHAIAQAQMRSLGVGLPAPVPAEYFVGARRRPWARPVADQRA